MSKAMTHNRIVMNNGTQLHRHALLLLHYVIAPFCNWPEPCLLTSIHLTVYYYTPRVLFNQFGLLCNLDNTRPR